jgi:hypothetical protein
MNLEFKNETQARKVTGLSYLGGVNTSAKVKKNMLINQLTYILYLAPANISRYNTCPNSTPECRLGCLNTSGRNGMEILSGKNIIQKARIKKTELLFENKDFFMNWLVSEITKFRKKAKKLNMEFSVRLNGTSDIDWQKINLNNQNIFEIFSDVQFYDYTKNVAKFKNLPENYHLTFSYSGRNTPECIDLLSKGFNIATIFDVKRISDLPETFLGYPVVSGDITDYRVKDGNGKIIGLKFKHIANKVAEKQVINSVFVVKHKDIS